MSRAIWSTTFLLKTTTSAEYDTLTPRHSCKYFHHGGFLPEAHERYSATLEATCTKTNFRNPKASIGSTKAYISCSTLAIKGESRRRRATESSPSSFDVERSITNWSTRSPTASTKTATCCFQRTSQHWNKTYIAHHKTYTSITSEAYGPTDSFDAASIDGATR